MATPGRIPEATGSAPLPPLARAFMAGGLAAFTVAGLYFGAPLLVPVVEAIVVCFVLNGVANAIRRLPVVGQRVPWAVALIAAALLALVIGFWAVDSSLEAVSAVGLQAGDVRERLGPLIERLAAIFGLTGRDLLDGLFDTLGLEAAVRSVATAVAATIGHFSIVAIYVAFLLVDQQFLDRKLRAIISDPAALQRTRAHLARIVRSIQTYLWIMTFVSSLTAVLSYGVMRAVGLENAEFWAIAIFFLNFIPTIGSILGTVIPTAVALLQFLELAPTALVLAGVGAIQFVIGNILLPRIAGGTLNISLTVTIFSLFFWGALWGVTGMFVAMPLTAMLILTMAQFAATRPVAIMLSRTGQLELPNASETQD